MTELVVSGCYNPTRCKQVLIVTELTVNGGLSWCNNNKAFIRLFYSPTMEHGESENHHQFLALKPYNVI